MAASVTGRSHRVQEIPAGTPEARAFDACSVAAPRATSSETSRDVRCAASNPITRTGSSTGLQQIFGDTFKSVFRQVEFAARMWRNWSFAPNRGDVTLHDEHLPLF